MLNTLITKIKTLLNFAENSYSILKQMEDKLHALETALINSRITQGKALEKLNIMNEEEIVRDINKSEFRVFSQWGDDGIINFLVNYLAIENKKFVEFGVENYTESNTRYLLINSNWKGLVLDGSKRHIDYIKNDEISWKYNLTAVEAFITAENINSLLSSNGFVGDIGLLHIDIDGNDYWVWKSISELKPVIVVVEYNSVFGVEHPWVIPYDSAFYRSQAHHSNLYAGASLLSLCDLGEEKGYKFIGSNSNGNNAYFVREDKLKSLKSKSAKEGYVLSEFAESRNSEGQLSYLRNSDRLDALRGMPIYNTQKHVVEYIN